jgi:hypothetical protein
MGQGCQGGGPGQPYPKSVQEGVQGRWVWATRRRGQPVDRRKDNVAGTIGQALGCAGGNKACQVSEEGLAFLRAPVPGMDARRRQPVQE